MTNRFQRPLFLGALFLLAFVARLIAAMGWEWHFGPRLVFGDSESYWWLARCLARGEAYQFGDFGTVFRMPGYPALLAPLFWVFEAPPTLAARIEGSLLGAVGVLITAIWAGRLFGRRAEWLAGLIMAFHPEMVLSSILILSEAAFLPVWTAHLLALSEVLCRNNPGGAVGRLKMGLLVGGLSGLATLIRPVSLLWLPLFAGTMLLFSRQRRQVLTLWIMAFLAFVIVMFPWWLRNYWVTGQWVLTTTQTGPTLYDGLHPQASGASNMDFVPQKFAELQQSMPDAGNVALEVEFNRRLTSEALRWAWSNPQPMLRLAATKFCRLWNPLPNDPGFNTFPANVILAVGFLCVIVLGMAGLFEFGLKGWGVAVCWFPAVYVTLLHLILVASIRYRWPALPGLMVLGAGFLAMIAERRKIDHDRR
jgi:4-amino-4-deoxy-L-arabinose transferase-like glycosyltransferase